MTARGHDGLTRRGVILGATRGLAACPLVAVTGPGADGDAVLVQVCQLFDRLERRAQATQALGANVAEDLACERLIERITARQAPLLHRIVATPARTGRGVRARAGSLALWDGDMAETGPAPWDRLLVRSLVMDLLTMAPDQVDRMGTAC